MNSFWRHVSSVFAGTVAAQLVPIIGSIFIARIFAPSEFGEFSTWLAVVAFVSVVMTLRLEAVLVITEDGMDRIRAVYIVFIVTCLMAVLFALFMIVADRLPGIKNYLFDSPILLLTVIPASWCLALNQVWQTWAAAEGFYGKLNAMRLVQAMTLILVQIGAGLKYPTAPSLVMGFVIASGIAFVWSIFAMPKFIHSQFFRMSEFRNFLSRYRNFPIYALPADSINTAAAQLPILVIDYRFGHEVAGYLALTLRVLGAPIGLVGKAVLDVFKRYAVQSIQEKGNCRKLYLDTLMALAFAALIMILGTVFLAKDIFYMAFGPDWILSGQMAVWLLPMFALRMIASPLSYMAYLVERQHIDLIWQSILMVMTIVTMYIFASYESTLIGYGIGYASMYFAYILISYRLSKG